MNHRGLSIGVMVLLGWTPWLSRAGDFGPGVPWDATQTSEPPTNPFLADSPWPMTHRNPYNQASSPYPGPTSASEAQPEFLDGEPVPITLAVSPRYPNGERAIWGTTPREVFKLVDRKGSMQYVDVWPRLLPRKTAISGAYSLLDRDGRYYVPRGVCIDAFCDKDASESLSSIHIASTFEVPAQLQHGDDDAIIGINMTYDGRIVFVTRHGLVGSLSRHWTTWSRCDWVNGEEEISNSVAVDERGGIFVVTERTINRVQWSGEASQRLRLTWRSSYRTSESRGTGRLGKGSGTTPTLVGVGQQDRFVAIGDGQKLMHVVLFWRDDIPDDWAGLPGRDRRIAAEVPVTFGDASATRSTTEQSLTVRGHEIFVVNNLVRQTASLGSRGHPSVHGQRHPLCHDLSIQSAGVAPYGVQKFRWDPRKRAIVIGVGQPRGQLS